MIELLREELLFVLCFNAAFFTVCIIRFTLKCGAVDWKKAALCAGKSILISWLVIALAEAVHFCLTLQTAAYETSLYQSGKRFCLLGIAAVFILCAVYDGLLDDDTKMLRAAALCCCAAVLIEIFLMNYGMFTVDRRDETPVELGNLTVWGNASFDSSSSEIVIGAGGGGLELKEVPRTVLTGLNVISRSMGPALSQISFWIKDEHFQYDYYECGSYSFVPGSSFSENFRIHSGGTLSGLKIQVDGNQIPIILTGITLNDYVPVFSLWRTGSIFLLLCLLLYVRRQLRRGIKADVRSADHHAVLLMMVLVCTIIVISIYQLPFEKRSIAYPLEKPVEEYDIYVQQFDSWMKGQLNLDIAADPALKSLANPYDKTARTYTEQQEEYLHYYTGLNVKLPYWWDHVYYGEKFYCYFGPAVLLTIYLPFYLITGMLPSNFCVTSLLAFSFCAAAAFLYREIMLRFFKKTYSLLYGLGYLGVIAMSTVFTLQVCIDTYNIAMLTGLFYLALFLAAFIRAVFSEGRIRAALYITAGIAFGMTALSRPGLMLYAVLLFPVWRSQFKKENWVREAVNLLCFGLPVLFFAFFTFIYNYLRFGSITEFGIMYQLTVYNVKYCTFELSDIFPAIYYFFLQLPVVNTVFPFVHMSRYAMPSYNSFCALESNVGAFAYPGIWVLAGAGRVFRRKKRDRYIRQTYVCMLLLTLFLAVFDFSFSGVTFRYSGDIMFILALLCVCLLMEFVELGEKTVLGMFIRRGAAVLLIGSILVSAAFVFENERGMISACYPQLINALQRTCMFWV